MSLEFTWDSKKAAANLQKHGVAFEEALTVSKILSHEYTTIHITLVASLEKSSSERQSQLSNDRFLEEGANIALQQTVAVVAPRVASPGGASCLRWRAGCARCWARALCGMCSI